MYIYSTAAVSNITTLCADTDNVMERYERWDMCKCINNHRIIWENFCKEIFSPTSQKVGSLYRDTVYSFNITKSVGKEHIQSGISFFLFSTFVYKREVLQ